MLGSKWFVDGLHARDGRMVLRVSVSALRPRQRVLLAVVALLSLAATSVSVRAWTERPA